MKKFILILLIITLFTLLLHAQNKVDVSGKKAKFDTSYVNSYKHYYSSYVNIITKYNRFELNLINTQDQEKISLEYNPNEKAKLGLGFHYKWLSLGIGILNMNPQDEDKYGKTEQFDLQLNIFLRSIIIDANIQNYTGFYISNPNSFNPLYTETHEKYPQYPKLKTTSLGASFFYVFNNKKFSYRAAFNQTEHQMKSAGSFLFGLSFSINAFRNPENIIPNELHSVVAENNYYKSSGIINPGIIFGYAYTYVFQKNYFATLSFVPGIALQTRRIVTENKDHNQLKINFSGTNKVRFAAGYNSAKHYLGISFSANNFTSKDKAESTSIYYSLGRVRIFYGRRFISGKN